jgi:hypothetical protein
MQAQCSLSTSLDNPKQRERRTVTITPNGYNNGYSPRIALGLLQIK